MTIIELDVEKNAFDNANQYFLKAKKQKEKLASLRKAMKEMDEKIARAKEVQETHVKKPSVKRVKEWFEKFHWFFTPNGFLVLAGRDKTSNEHLVKKVMQPKDVYFHGTAHGSAHTILVTNGKNPQKEDLTAAAQFAGIWSGDWKSGVSQTDVYSVKPEQVSKKAPTGESMGSGAFMIYGERTWYRKVPLEISVGIDDKDRLASGPPKAFATKGMVLIPGEKKKSDVAKSLQKYFDKQGKTVSLDDLMSMIPSLCRMKAQ